MTVMMTIHFLPFLCALASVAATRVPNTALPTILHSDPGQHQGRFWAAEGVVQLDLERVVRRRMERRNKSEAGEAGMGAIGLGDALDITYNVLIQVGNISTPLVLDTGSADLWVLSDSCSTCTGSFPLYPSESLESVADARLLYGDSRTGTHAYGIIGADGAGIAGLVLEGQYFAAINDTNTSVLDTGSAGIFGLGFPVNSLLWNELYTIASLGSSSSKSKRRSPSEADIYSRPRALPSPPPFPPSQNLAVGEDAIDTSSMINQIDILSSFATYGPLISRLVLNGASARDSYSTPFLDSPIFSVALQRTTPAPGGNVGSLTLGALPSGVDNTSLAWAHVRRYTEQQNGVIVPQVPEETYPYAWDIPLDEVYFDGVRLPISALGDVSLEGVGQSALIDTGNSLIRGPADVVVAILSLLCNSTSPSPFVNPSSASLDVSGYTEEDYVAFTQRFDSLAYAYPCAEPHTIAFEFAGQRFQVDPRDFGRPVGDPEEQWCVPNLAPTDAPKVGGYLYNWSLGEPFLRGVLASFYYGNLTHPSSDLPRVGFLSTVPDDAPLRLAAAVRSAQSAGGYPETTIPAPTGTFSGGSVTTDAQGAVQATEAPLPFDSTSSSALGLPNEDGTQERQGSGAPRLCTPFDLEFSLRHSTLFGVWLVIGGVWLFA